MQCSRSDGDACLYVDHEFSPVQIVIEIIRKVNEGVGLRHTLTLCFAEQLLELLADAYQPGQTVDIPVPGSAELREDAEGMLAVTNV